jgi:site-specific recombinase
MAYVLKNKEGEIIAASPDTQVAADWVEVENTNSEYLDFLDNELKKHHTFRESDIQLARVLEDLISILIDRSLISFTDFPSAAQKRLNERQNPHHKNKLNLLGDDDVAHL